MANATARVPMATTPWGDDKIRRTPADAVKTFYPGMMIALNSSGLAVSCDDTSGIRFDGINSETVNIPILTSGSSENTDPAKAIPVERPWRFVMAIASATAGDEGKALYAVDDNHVGYTSSHSILVGFVDQVLTSTSVLVNPIYAPLNPVAVSSNTLAFAGTTGANQITFPDNLADGLSIAEGSNEYLTFTSTDSSETVTIKKLLTFADAVNIAFNATTGTKIGTATSQKLAFYNATPIVQPANTVDYVTALVNLGLRASGGTAAATFPGRLVGALLNETAYTGDVYAATNTIDVTKGLHVIAVSNGTSAASTWTPSAAGTAGDLLILVTEADGTGTVTVTFASTFHSSGTQATTLSKFSSIAFVSDGTRWVELFRTTALT